MKVFEAKISEIKPYGNNPRVITKEAIDKVANSIREFGMQQPIVVDKDMVIIVGHTRLQACQSLGMTTVPCVIAENLTEEQVRAYRLADNKTNEFTSWDDDLLNFELNTICEIDMGDFGFEMATMEEEKEASDDDYDPDSAYNKAKDNCTVQPGDVFRLEDHILLCGDSTSLESIKKLMGGGVADMCLTDPPYNVAYEGKGKDKLTIKNDSKESSEFRQFLRGAFTCMAEAIRPGAPYYVWFASREHINFEGALNDVGLQVREEIIWNKNAMTLGRQDYQWKHEPCLYGWKEGASHSWYGERDKTTVLDFDKPAKSDMHPTMKPVPLFGALIQYSTKKGDVVLDLFGGSGTTLIACEQLGRKCRLIELDPIYCQVIINRWEEFTGKKAVKIVG